MATHSTNASSGTHIVGSTVSIDTLNVNKTSTHEEIMNSLPSYHEIDATKFSTSTTISLDTAVNTDHIENSMFFVNGQALSKMIAAADSGPGYYLTADGNNLTIAGFANLNTSQIHGLYTGRT